MSITMSILNQAAALPAAQCSDMNPFCGVVPSFSAFGVEFQGKLQLLLGGIWALVLAATAVALLLGVGKYAYAAKRSHNSDDLAAGSAQMQRGAIGFGAAVGISVLLGAVIFFVQ